MNFIMDIFGDLSRGTLDSLRGSLVLFYMDKNMKEKALNSSPRRNISSNRKIIRNYKNNEEPKILKRTLECCALNGGVFWASLLIFDTVLLPFLKMLVGFVMGNTSSTGIVWFWIKMFLSWTFSAIWVLPLLLLSKIVNNLWFMDIADLAYRHSRGNVYVPRSVSFAVADTFFSIFVQILFLVQSVLVCFLPSPFGQLIWLVHICMLYSLYSFEYRWVNMGWELHHRLTYIENHWPYFIGFGLPLALLTSLPSSYIVSGCVFSILFPLFIVSSNEADLVSDIPRRVILVEHLLYDAILQYVDGISPGQRIRNSWLFLSVPLREMHGDGRLKHVNQYASNNRWSRRKLTERFLNRATILRRSSSLLKTHSYSSKTALSFLDLSRLAAVRQTEIANTLRQLKEDDSNL